MVLLAAYLLPFHSHAQTVTPRLIEECSCVLTGRQELAQPSPFCLNLPTTWATLVEPIAIEIVSSLCSFDYPGRAPPLR